MDYISVAVSVLIEMLIVYLFCNKIQERKVSNGIVALTFVLCSAFNFAIYFVVLYIKNAVLINLLASLVTFSLLSIVCYKGKLFTKFIYGILLSLIMIAGEYICIVPFTTKMIPMTVNEDMNTLTAMLFSFISKIAFLLISQITAIIIAKHSKTTNSNDKRYSVLLIIPVFTFIITFCNMLICANVNINKLVEYTLRVSITVLVAVSVLIFVYYQIFDENDRKLKELEKEKQFVELNNSYMQVLEHQNNDMHMIVHDVKNHYATIASMTNIDDVHDYIDSISDDVQRYQVIRLTDNKMLDLLLSKYKVECNSKGIKLNTEIKTANLNYIDDSDLSILICNLLDNAIEAATQSKKKTISFSLRKVNEFDVLNVINSCDNEPDIKHNKIATSKADKTAHGYGMKIISKYAKKNNAEYEWHYEDKTNTFNSILIFKK